MEPPSKLLLKLSRRLFAENPSEQEQFIDRLTHPEAYSPCILWCRDKPAENPFSGVEATPWQPDFVDRLSPSEQPGKHPLHQAGYYYCLDFSSVFAASCLLHLKEEFTSEQPIIFDICAAPGGKSIFAWRSLNPRLILCNEVIGKRLGMLFSNLNRCQIQPAFVVNQDPQALAEIFPKTSHIVLVDAPCTGQSLLAKGLKAPGCFHPSTINQNANRQKRIIANAAEVVAPQGYLLYMTCAYSLEENEGIGTWFLKKFPQFQAVKVPHLESYQSQLAEFPCYRMFPQSGLGAGSFAVLFKNTEIGQRKPIEMEDLIEKNILKILKSFHSTTEIDETEE